MRASVLVAPLCCWLAVGPALADEPPRKAVVLMRAGGIDAATWDAALLAIRAQLGDIAVRVAVERGPDRDDLRAAIDAAKAFAAGDHAIGAFWLSAQGPDVMLYVAEPTGGRVLVRRVQGGAEAAALEEIAVIARGSVEALLEGRAIGMEPIARPPTPEAPRAVPTRIADARPPDRTLARTLVALSGDAFAPTTPWQAGLAIGAAWSPLDRVFIGAGYALFGAVDVEAGPASARVSRHPLEIGLAYEVPFGPVSIGGEMLGELDALTRTTTRVGAGVRAAPDDLRWLGAVGGRARVLYQVAPPFRVFVNGGVDVLLNAFQYVIEGASGGTSVLAPNRFRPRLDLGLAVDLR
jgi:hypothetical protein